ncbi:hypothetical protein BaRGS_00024974 [Batillaria attramentaria]|uniref:Uncharacterized protein n=1 Tax=Batillaria attramentaria TaxID=370345 RepID=A0ABD0K9M6_9CAEN
MGSMFCWHEPMKTNMMSCATKSIQPVNFPDVWSLLFSREQVCGRQQQPSCARTLFFFKSENAAMYRNTAVTDFIHNYLSTQTASKLLMLARSHSIAAKLPLAQKAWKNAMTR